MKKRLLFCSFLGVLTACHRETDIQPGTASLANEVAGVYHTNFYLDPSYVAIPAGQMPHTELKAESDSNVTLIITKSYPAQQTQIVPHVLLKRQDDRIQLLVDGASIGTLQTDRIFTDNGMEKQGRLLRINPQSSSQNTLSFTGIK